MEDAEGVEGEPFQTAGEDSGANHCTAIWNSEQKKKGMPVAETRRNDSRNEGKDL